MSNLLKKSVKLSIVYIIPIFILGMCVYNIESILTGPLHVLLICCLLFLYAAHNSLYCYYNMKKTVITNRLKLSIINALGICVAYDKKTHHLYILLGFVGIEFYYKDLFYSK